jgi:hypothetical protein
MKIKESQPTQSLLLAVVAIALFGCASLPLEHGDFVQGKQGAVSGRSAHNRSDVRRAKRTQTDMEPYCAICGKPPSKIRRNDAHHTLPVSYDPLELYVADLDNLETLCRSCHFRWGHASNWSFYNVNLIECIDKVDDAREQIERNIR